MTVFESDPGDEQADLYPRGGPVFVALPPAERCRCGGYLFEHERKLGCIYCVCSAIGIRVR